MATEENLAKHPMNAQFVSVLDYERQAPSIMAVPIYGYYKSGAGDEITLRENRSAFDRIFIRPRFFRNVRSISLKTTILGMPVDSPVGIAPSALHKLCTPEGERATAKAAAHRHLKITLSTLARMRLEEVADGMREERKGGFLFLQLYIFKDRDMTMRFLNRAVKAGFKAIVLTIDAPGGLGLREMDMRNNFSLPKGINLANFTHEKKFHEIAASSGGSAIRYFSCHAIEDTLTWDTVAWLKKVSKLPVVLKGVLTPEDAVLAARHGADAIWISNHGGRQLDGYQATIDVLYPIAQALKGTNVEVYVDSGVRRGTDVLKCLALGARAVFVGRPVLWGLALRGAEGAKHVIDILNFELKEAMKLTGVTSVQELTADYISLPPDSLHFSPATLCDESKTPLRHTSRI